MKQRAWVLACATVCNAMLLSVPSYSQGWIGLPQVSQPPDLPSHLDLPSRVTIKAMEDLETLGEVPTSFENAGKWTLPAELTPGASVDPEQVPLYEDKMILSFDQDVGSQLNSIVEEYDLKVLSSSPETAQLTVQYDLKKYLKPLPGEEGNETIGRGLVEAMQDFERIPGVVIAAPSTFSFPEQDEEPLESVAGGIVQLVPTVPEHEDWGIADIQANALWGFEGASDGAVFGVLDVGFARHKDLTYVDVDWEANKADDHGTHVAGVACARHNSIGVRGVLPNCLIKAVHSRAIFPLETETAAAVSPQTEFVVIGLTEINEALVELLDEGSEARTFNVSLGANWRRLRMDPEVDPFWAMIISGQGRTLARPLALAAQQGKVVFSAAGNDSSASQVRNPRYSSALNYAIIELRSQGISAGLIVAAHDINGERAPFSNAPADISCPGVDVLSTVAYHRREMSDQTYGLMSGTSMATPYCASGYELLSLVLPDLAPEELLRCMIETGEHSGETIPRLKLLKAYELCSTT